MQKVIPFIWFENQAERAAEFYAGILPDSSVGATAYLPGTPSGTASITSLRLCNTEFQFMNAGQLADRNPSFSYMIACDTEQEVDKLWQALSQNLRAQLSDEEALAQGLSAPATLLELGEYPFSKRFGWLEDSFNVSWQIMHVDNMSGIDKLTPCLLFVGDVAGKGEDAVKTYTKLIEGSEILSTSYVEEGSVEQQYGEIPGNLRLGRFSLAGAQFVAMDSAIEHKFGFNAMQSLLVNCASQGEIDRYWNALSADPASEQCGWLRDRFGISWQIVPESLQANMEVATTAQMKAMLATLMPMKKLNAAAIQEAYTSTST